jgi:Type II secretion system (T2SS), protein N
MPVSRSPNRDTKPVPRSRSIWPLVLIGLVAVLAVIVAALPASAVAHFLPASVQAEDFSGSIWHGSAGKFTVNAHNAGALEWRVHPGALLGLAMAADIHWVKTGFVVDARVSVDRQGFAAHAIKGGGPIEDLQEFGVAVGWSGTAGIDFSEIKGDFARQLSAVGDVQVSNLTSPQIAEGADLGGYDLHVGAGAVASDGTVTAQLKDTGGPLDLQAVVRYSAKQHLGLLTGTVKERANAPPALLQQLQSLSQLRGRDPEGRIPIDLEFTAP